jgi:hypothetical protein
VVTTYTGGSVLYPTSYEVDNINGNDPSGAHPITISFNPVQGAIAYSVLRTTFDIQPNFPCICLIGTTSGNAFAVDSGAVLGAFAPTFITPATGDIRLNNKDYTPPVFESIVNGVTTPFYSGVGVYVPYTGATKPVDLGAYGATGSSFTTNGDTSGTLQLSGIASGVVTGTVTQTVNNTTGTWTLTWPTSAGTVGYVLSTDGAGVTSWVAKSTGFTGTKTAGSCTFTIVNGIITNVTGC